MARKDETAAPDLRGDETSIRAGEMLPEDHRRPSSRNFTADPGTVLAQRRDTPGDPLAEGDAANDRIDPDIVPADEQATAHDKAHTPLVYSGARSGDDRDATARPLEQATTGMGDAAYWRDLHGFTAMHAGQAIDMNAPSGRSYHFALGASTPVHTEDTGFFLEHGVLQFARDERPKE